MDCGHLTVICGCMFSGKSERLLDRLRAAVAAGRQVAAFKHACDDRYSTRQIVTHTGQRIEAIPISSADAMFELAGEADLVGIDEAQFFGRELVEVCRKLVAEGRQVIVAGLDLDSWGLPFGPMPELIGLADAVETTRGHCARCGGPADHTQRLALVEGVKMVGGPECYEPRCAACFEPPPPQLRR